MIQFIGETTEYDKLVSPYNVNEDATTYSDLDKIAQYTRLPVEQVTAIGKQAALI